MGSGNAAWSLAAKTLVERLSFARRDLRQLRREATSQGGADRFRRMASVGMRRLNRAGSEGMAYLGSS